MRHRCTASVLTTFLLAIVLFAGCGPAPLQGASRGASLTALAASVSVADAAELRSEGAFMLDVREPAEWADGHIPGATLIPLGELVSRIDEVPRDQVVVVVCRSGNRSAEGRDILLASRYPAVTSLDGGMTDWTRAGMPIEIGG